MRRSAIWMATLALVVGAWAAGSAPLQVADAWIRWLPGAVPAGGYLTLINQGDTAVTLTGASSDDFGSVSLHQSRKQGGVSSMRPVDEITVKPHSKLVLADEGYHLMLMEPKKTLSPGDRVVITLHFSDGRAIPAPFQLRSPDMLMSK